MNSRIRRTLPTVAVAAALVLTLGACSGGGTPEATGSEGSTDLGTIKVGALATPAGEILDFVNENVAPGSGLEIENVPFTDYQTPNPALTDGSVDANLFQHKAFLDDYLANSGDDLVSVGEVYLPAMGLYSDKVGSTSELADGASIALPNDPSNEARALELLAADGLIEIEDGASTLDGITANPKNLAFTELENASLAQTLPDQDAAIVTASFALPAGLTQDDAILLEGTDSPYYNILATRADLQDDPRVAKLYELLTDQRTKDFITETWGGLIVPVD